MGLATAPRKLRGAPPKAIEKRLKCLFFGEPGVGKTTAAIQFPKPYIIDTERGAQNDQYVKAMEKAGAAYLFTTDPDELIAEVTALLQTEHPYVTLVIDPLTVIYNDLLDKGMDSEGTEFGRYKIPADRKIKHLLNLLLRLDMNVIITSHAKPKWEKTKDAKGKDIAVQSGNTFDCYGRLDYLFDLVFEIQKRGKERVGVVRKSRVEAFPDGDQFPFTYDSIADKYGRAILERGAIPEALATAEQLAELTELLGVRSDGDALREKWLTAAKADQLSEMKADDITKCIAFLKKGL